MTERDTKVWLSGVLYTISYMHTALANRYPPEAGARGAKGATMTNFDFSTIPTGILLVPKNRNRLA